MHVFKDIVYLGKEGMDAGLSLSIAAGAYSSLFLSWQISTWRAWVFIRNVFNFQDLPQVTCNLHLGLMSQRFYKFLKTAPPTEIKF